MSTINNNINPQAPLPKDDDDKGNVQVSNRNGAQLGTGPNIQDGSLQEKEVTNPPNDQDKLEDTTNQNLKDTIKHHRKLSGRFKKAAIATGVAAAALAVGAVIVKFVPVIAALVASFAPLPAVVIGLGVAAAILGGIAITCAVYFLYNKKKDNDGQSNNTPTQTTNINQKEETNSQNEQLENDNDKPQNGEQIDTNPNVKNGEQKKDEDKLQNEQPISPTDNNTAVPEIYTFLSEFKEKNLKLFREMCEFLVGEGKQMCEFLVGEGKQALLRNEWDRRIDETIENIDETIENIVNTLNIIILTADENLSTSTAAQKIAEHIIEQCYKLDDKLRKYEQEVEKAKQEYVEAYQKWREANSKRYKKAKQKLREANQEREEALKERDEACQKWKEAKQKLREVAPKRDEAYENRTEAYKKRTEALKELLAKEKQADEARLPIIAYRGILGTICEYVEKNEHAIDNEFYNALKECTEEFVSLSKNPEDQEAQQKILKVIIEKILERKLEIRRMSQSAKQTIQDVVGEFFGKIKGKLIYKMREIFRNLKMPVSPL